MTVRVDHKTIVLEFFDRFSQGDVDGAVDLLSRDATWWLPGQPDEMPSAGLYTKDEIAILFDRMTRRLRGGLLMTVTGMVAEGDTVAVQVESTGELHNGRSYHNQYHTLMRFRDGQIAEVREYQDTRHAYQVWHRD